MGLLGFVWASSDSPIRVGANRPSQPAFPKRAGVGSPVNSRNLQPRLRSLPAAAAGRLTQGPFSAVDGAAEPPRRRPYAGRLMTRLEGVGAQTVCGDLPYFRIL